jgi:hypothetical protein
MGFVISAFQHFAILVMMFPINRLTDILGWIQTTS